MPNNESTPLLAGDDDSIISKNSVVAGENNNKDPEALADGPRIPGIKLSVIIPAMAVGVWSSSPTWNIHANKSDRSFWQPWIIRL